MLFQIKDQWNLACVFSLRYWIEPFRFFKPNKPKKRLIEILKIPIVRLWRWIYLKYLKMMAWLFPRTRRPVSPCLSVSWSVRHALLWECKRSLLPLPTHSVADPNTFQIFFCYHDITMHIIRLKKLNPFILIFNTA